MKTRSCAPTKAQVHKAGRFLALLAGGVRHRDALAQAAIEWDVVSRLTLRPEWAKRYAAALASRDRVWKQNRASPVVLRKWPTPR